MSAQDSPLPGWLSASSRELLTAAGRLVELRPRRPVSTERGEVHLLLSGTARVLRVQGQRPLLLALLRAPTIFGHLAALSDGPPSERTVTLSACRTFALPAQIFRVILARDARVSWTLSWELAERAAIAGDLHAEALACTVEQRLARLLLDYARLIPGPGPEGQGPVVRTTQEMLAADLGLCRRSVGATLARLRSGRLIEWTHGRCVILNPAELARRASTRRSLVRGADPCPLDPVAEHEADGAARRAGARA